CSDINGIDHKNVKENIYKIQEERCKMDFSIPNEVKEVVASIERFIKLEVEPIRKQYEKYLTNDRYFYDENGLYAKETMEVVREVRRRSAKAGFFHMFADPELGGTGDMFGPVNMALIHEMIYRK